VTTVSATALSSPPAQAAVAVRAAITRFTGPDDHLSNFSAHPVRWQGLVYPTAEAAFQAGKTLDPTVRAEIAAAATPARAKQLGRALALRPGWDAHLRHTVMREVLAAKFSDPQLAARLVGTGTALLVEGNAWCDQFWGCCTCPRHRSTPGQNWLGRHLMHLRATLAPARQAHQWTRVACTGHRPHLLPAGSHAWVEAELHRVAGKLVAEHGTQVAISGAAAGADLMWAEAGHTAGARVWLYQPYPDHDARWEQSWRDRLTAARALATRVDTLGSRYSVEVLHARSDWMLRDCDALIAVIDPRRRSGGTVTALRRVRPGTPVIHLDVWHQRTSISLPTAA
jgi:ribA/ribD-fused uncharacterized protein